MSKLLLTALHLFYFVRWQKLRSKMIELIQGDCLQEMQNIPDKSVDSIICDLPYGTTACKWDTIIPFEPLWKQYKRIIKDNGAIVLFASQPFTSAFPFGVPKLVRLYNLLRLFVQSTHYSYWVFNIPLTYFL